MSDLSLGSSEATEQRLECRVMKFGGTSVGDAPAIQRVSDLVRQRLRHRPVVVVSALAKVTDQLLGAGKAAAEGRLEPARETVRLLRDRHEQLAAGLLYGEEYERLRSQLEREFRELDQVVLSIAAEGQFTPRAQDNLLGRGESFSSRIVQAALLQNGLDASCA